MLVENAGTGKTEIIQNYDTKLARQGSGRDTEQEHRHVLLHIFVHPPERAQGVRRQPRASHLRAQASRQNRRTLHPCRELPRRRLAKARQYRCSPLSHDAVLSS